MSEEFELISVPKELLENLVRRILSEYISLSAPRKPFVRLSEEEISKLWDWAKTAEAEKTAPTQIHAFARAIEDALEEKNK